MEEEAPRSWQTYFPDDAFKQDDRRVLLIDALCRFLLGERGWSFLTALRFVLRSYLSLRIDVAALLEQSKLSNLRMAIQHQPEECFGCLGAAVYEVLFETNVYQQQVKQLLGCLPSARRVFIRPVNVSSLEVTFKDIQSGAIGKLVSIRGTAIQVSPARPVAVSLSYTCNKCKTSIPVECPDGRPVAPKACLDGCKSKAFQAAVSSICCADWQRIRLQEIIALDDDDQQSRGPPKILDVEITRDMVSGCACGDEVSVLGYVRVSKGEAAGKLQNGIMLLHIDAVSLLNYSRSDTDIVQGCQGERRTVFAEADLHFIRTLHSVCSPNILLYLAQSLCPAILGMYHAKLALTLALLGGSNNVSGSNTSTVRSNIHVMLIGDPGLGKSQLLHACVAASPRGIYVCSNTSTTAGLTLSVSKDAVTNEMAFTAGALVLADGGVCCLDELDNMRGEHKTLLEVMEQQEVCSAKGALTAQMPARTTVIAAANPTGGVYVRAKSLQENAKMSSALFSRFDLTFGLTDDADTEQDLHLSAHVMRVHCKGDEPARKAAKTNTKSAPHSGDAVLRDDDDSPTLVQRMRDFEAGELLPAELIRQFVSYARQYCHPKLTHEAKLVIKQFYLQLREKAAVQKAVCITVRQCESLVRLTQARARAELRTEATAEDAQDAVELMVAAMRDLFRDGATVGGPGGRSKARGKGGSKRKDAEMLVERMREIKRIEGKKEFSQVDLEVIKDDLRLYAASLDTYLEALNEAGEVLRKGKGLWAPA